MIEVDHSSGYITRYAHAKLLLISVDVAEKGQESIVIGGTVRPTGIHVHYGVSMYVQQIDTNRYIHRLPS